MGLKKRNKTSAEFSMSSLTDIIFLLLIFFMLTANFVQVKPFELPESNSKTVAPTDIAVSVDNKGNYFLNGKEMPSSALRGAIKRELKESKNKKGATITIAAEVGTAFDPHVVRLMEIAQQLNMKAILASSPK